MMKKSIIIVLILHSLILFGIPSGHGFGLMILLDILCVPMIFQNDLEEFFIVAGIISLTGKLLLIISFFVKDLNTKNSIVVIGLIALLISFFLIIIENSNDTMLTLLPLIFGVPFLLYLGRVLYLMNKKLV
ncbi:hypothetical protein [Maribacter sp.]|uniref:hypothetical protein n=1 Tax=Maribacter sp. TaxID=1897614 RepID=UPI003299EA56